MTTTDPAAGTGEPRLRPARESDADRVIALIRRVYTEYAGCVLDVDHEEPELRTPASSFERFWVLEQRGTLVGCCGCSVEPGPGDERYLLLRKLYVDRSVRGRGYGSLLVRQAEDFARKLGLRRIELWSDTRFTTSHAVYKHLGYVQSGRTRELHDLSRTTEYHFWKEL